MTSWRGERDTRLGREQRSLGSYVHLVQHSSHLNRAYKTLVQGKDKTLHKQVMFFKVIIFPVKQNVIQYIKYLLRRQVMYFDWLPVNLRPFEIISLILRSRWMSSKPRSLFRAYVRWLERIFIVPNLLRNSGLIQNKFILKIWFFIWTNLHSLYPEMWCAQFA